MRQMVRVEVCPDADQAVRSGVLGNLYVCLYHRLAIYHLMNVAKRSNGVDHRPQKPSNLGKVGQSIRQSGECRLRREGPVEIKYLYILLCEGKPREAYWEAYWEIAVARQNRLKLRNPDHAAFAHHVASEERHLKDVLAAHRNGAANDKKHLAASVAWVLRGQAATPDAGVSRGYFPISGGWEASYPETTGYLITSLFAYAAQYRRNDVRAAAMAMADWEIEIQMPNGAVQGGAVVPRERQTPAAFNTGMVLDGWCSAYEASHEPRYLEAGRAAARFLLSNMDADGYFIANGDFVSRGETKTYNCLCAWSMLRLARFTCDAELERAAVCAVQAALRREADNGWFANNDLVMSNAPLTHTIGYTLQGVFEVGVLAEREDFIAAAERGLDSALARQRPDGFLAGRFDRHWKAAADFVCLTGSCQLAIVAYRFAEALGRREFLASADHLIDFVKATQRLESEDPDIVGAIAGSYPILSTYSTAGFPNWAAKYFIDALMLRRRLHESDGRSRNAETGSPQGRRMKADRW